MKRFFGTSAVLRRIPPNAPAHVKEVPVPRSARTTAELGEIVGHADEPGHEHSRGARPSRYLASVFPDASANLTLANPEGVWYHVDRSRSGNLPVYTDYNNAGGAWTEVRKIRGNVGALKNDLKKALDLSKADIWVKNAAPVVVIKGNYVAEVKELLGTAF